MTEYWYCDCRHNADMGEVVRRVDYDKLEATTKYIGDCNARNADRANRLEAALRRARPYVYNAAVADAADLEARHSTLSEIDGLLPQANPEAKHD